jgi:cell division protein ZapB
MPTANPNSEAVRALTSRLDELLALARRLADENRSLRQNQEALMSERANLLAKNEQARSRVEAMISRLRSLEQNG